MNSFILNVETLPVQIRKCFHTPKVSVQERDGNIILMPLQEGSGLFGIAAKDNLTVDKLYAYKKADRTFDK